MKEIGISKESAFSRYFQLALVVMSAGSIYPIIYLRSDYQETILYVFELELYQLNIIFAVLGFVFLIGYFPSGYLADRFSAKKLMSLSLFATAAGGFWFAQIPTYNFVILIFCIWGFFSVFTFWSAHMKVVKLLAKSGEDGRLFGILDGGRGLVEAFLAMGALLIFSTLFNGGGSQQNPREALVGVVYMYSFAILIVAILVTIFVKDDKSAIIQQKKEVNNRSNFYKLLKNKRIYLLGAIIFMGYSVFWTIRVMVGFIEVSLGTTSVTAATVMVAVTWMRPIGGIVGGFIADKIGKANVNLGATFITSTLLIIITFFGTIVPQNIAFALIVLTALFAWTVRGTYWSLLGDCNVDNKTMGTAIGLISLVGYMPDVLSPIANTVAFNIFGDTGGYSAYFIFSAVLGFIGVGLIVIFKVTHKVKKHV